MFRRTRTPKGVPTGGQYSASAHDESSFQIDAPRLRERDPASECQAADRRRKSAKVSWLAVLDGTYPEGVTERKAEQFAAAARQVLVAEARRVSPDAAYIEVSQKHPDEPLAVLDADWQRTHRDRLKTLIDTNHYERAIDDLHRLGQDDSRLDVTPKTVHAETSSKPQPHTVLSIAALENDASSLFTGTFD